MSLSPRRGAGGRDRAARSLGGIPCHNDFMERMGMRLSRCGILVLAAIGQAPLTTCGADISQCRTKKLKDCEPRGICIYFCLVYQWVIRSFIRNRPSSLSGSTVGTSILSKSRFAQIARIAPGASSQSVAAEKRTETGVPKQGGHMPVYCRAGICRAGIL